MTEQKFIFTCAHCRDRSARVEERDRDIRTGETYHCGSCGIRIIFHVVTVDCVLSPRAGRDCAYCGPSPRKCRTFATQDIQKGETK